MIGHPHKIGRAVYSRTWFLAASLAVFLCLAGACADHQSANPAEPAEQQQTFRPPESEAVHNVGVEYEAVGTSILATFDATVTSEGGGENSIGRILFRAPDTFWPDEDHIREVTVRVETADGASTNDEQRAIVQVRMAANGHAYLVNRLPDIRGTPVRIRGTVVYPAAGSSPAVCARTRSIRRAILSELHKLGYRRDYGCQDVRWRDLAAIQSLESTPVQTSNSSRLSSVEHMNDLAGLVHLTRARLSAARAPEVGGEMFAHTPNLETMDLWLGAADRNEVVGNPEFFRHVPNLAALHLHVHNDVYKLHPDILAAAPQLRSLALSPYYWSRGWAVVVIPADFLAHVPNLEMLHLTSIRDLPADLLAHVPRLRELSVTATRIPPHFLRHSRSLTDLDLNLLRFVPDGLLAPVPELQRLRVDADELQPAMLADSRYLTDLYLASYKVPEGFLSHASRLEWLELSGGFRGQPMIVPANAFRGLHGLTDLTIRAPYGLTFSGGKTSGGSTGTAKDGVGSFGLPPEWLAATPGLESLSMDFAYTAVTFPPAFFANTPALVSLNVKADSMVVSDRLLDGARGLRRLILDGTIHTPPADLLASTPDLTELKLSSGTTLDRRFFMHVPALKDLDLRMPESVDEELFGLLPDLERLSLYVDGRLPEHMALALPNLYRLELVADGELPPNLLGDTPNLTHVKLAPTSPLPSGLFRTVSALTHLHLVLSDPMPSELLSHTRGLRRLYIAGDFVDYEFDLPALEYLTLVAQDYGLQLPRNFLKGMPALQYMDLLWGTRKPGGSFYLDWSKVNLSHTPQLKIIVFGFRTFLGFKRCASLSPSLAAYATNHYLFNLSSLPNGLQNWNWSEHDLLELCLDRGFTS